jgi:hypothetical protein
MVTARIRSAARCCSVMSRRIQRMLTTSPLASRDGVAAIDT